MLWRMSTEPFDFRVHPERLAIARLAPDAPLPRWANGGFVTVSRTPEELSIVCAERRVPDARPAGPAASALQLDAESPLAVERGRAALSIVGNVPMTTIGVLASLCAALAAERISVFAISTYETDWLLVRADRLDDARAALERLGHRTHGESPRA